MAKIIIHQLYAMRCDWLILFIIFNCTVIIMVMLHVTQNRVVRIKFKSLNGSQDDTYFMVNNMFRIIIFNSKPYPRFLY